jgi:hypothetical protein
LTTALNSDKVKYYSNIKGINIMQIIDKHDLGVIPLSPLGVMQDIINRNAFTLGLSRDMVIDVNKQMEANVQRVFGAENSSKRMNLNTLSAFFLDLPHLEILQNVTFEPHSENALAMVYSKPNAILMNRLSMAAEINPVAAHYLQLEGVMTSPLFAERVAADAGNKEDKNYYQHMMAFYEIFGHLEHKKFHYATPYLPDSQYRVYQARAEVKLPASELIAASQQKTITHRTAVAAKSTAAALDIFQAYLPDILGLKDNGFWYALKEDVRSEEKWLDISTESAEKALDFDDTEYAYSPLDISVSTGYQRPYGNSASIIRKSKRITP